MISAYWEVLGRLTSLYAHCTGESEEYILHYGGSRLSLTQAAETPSTGGSTFQTPKAADAKTKVKNTMRRPLFAQPSTSSERFNFKFASNLAFDHKGKHNICLSIGPTAILIGIKFKLLFTMAPNLSPLMEERESTASTSAKNTSVHSTGCLSLRTLKRVTMSQWG